MARQGIRLLLCWMALTSPFCLAGDWKHAIQACNDAAKQVARKQGKPGAQAAAQVSLLGEIKQLKRFAVEKVDERYPWEDCVIKLGGLDWLGPTFGSIAPGGSFAPGLRIQHPASSNKTESLWIARGYYSVKNFYFIEGRYDRHFPLIPSTDEKATISFFARRMDLKQQDFYGLGQFSSPNALAEYRQQQDEIGVTGYFPILPWFAAGGRVQGVMPAVHGMSDPKIPSVEKFFPTSELPGFPQQPVFFNPGAFIRIHTPYFTDQTWNKTDVRLNYDHFGDTKSGVNTFERLQASVEESFEIRFNIKRGSLPKRTTWQNFWCEGIVGDQCRAGNIVLNGVVTTSFTGTGQVVPFYLQPTLGGTDINGLDTLRGLPDYRLRAPNRMLLQADYYHDIWGPLGFYGFADTGRVALTPSDLGFSHLRDDFGVGAYFRAGGNIILRAYIAFGAGEGSQKNVKFFSAF